MKLFSTGKNNIQAKYTLYLCICGSLTQGIRGELSQVFKQAKLMQQSVALMNLDAKPLKDLQKMLEEHKCSYTIGSTTSKAPLENIRDLLSQVAKTLGALTRIRTSNVDQDDDEEELVKRKRIGKKGRKI